MTVRSASIVIGVLALAIAGLARAAVEPRPLAERDLFYCGGATFPRAVMSSPKGVELAPDPAAQELRRWLDDPTDNVDFEFPRRGWQRLEQTAVHAVFGWGKRAGRLRLYVNMGPEQARWKVVGYGDCRPMLFVPGMETTPWTLKRLPKPSARTVHLVLHSGSCSPRHAKEDVQKRFDHIEFAGTRRTIRLLALVRETPRTICAGVGISYPVTVRLPERLGRRVLRDAAFAPSVRIADLRSGRCFGHCGPHSAPF